LLIGSKAAATGNRNLVAEAPTTRRTVRSGVSDPRCTVRELMPVSDSPYAAGCLLVRERTSPPP